MPQQYNYNLETHANFKHYYEVEAYQNGGASVGKYSNVRDWPPQEDKSVTI